MFGKLARFFSFGLLAFQLYIPWSVEHLATQDGPAHVYTAFVTRDLVLHRHTSPYHEMYRVQKSLLPNWTCTVLLAGFLSAFGPDHAEAFLMSFCLLVGYGSFAYCLRVLNAGAGGGLLVANWLLQSWFLWGGFYNFYLGLVLLPLVLGGYLRYRSHFTWRRAAVLAAALVLLFFTHLLPAVLAVVTLAVLGLWLREGWRQGAMLAAALAPATSLILAYAMHQRAAETYSPKLWDTLVRFPGNVFVLSSGWAGEQRYVWIVAVCFIVIACFCLARDEWRGPQGGLAFAAILMFIGYLIVPDAGLGGSVVKLRFAWAVFLFGGLVLCCAKGLGAWRSLVAVALGLCVLAQLVVISRRARVTSQAITEYLAATDLLPEGAHMVRMKFPTPGADARFGTDHLTFDPLLHLASLGAVRRHAVDLSDYQSATGTFIIQLKPSIDPGKQATLWAFESSGNDSWISLEWLRRNMPVSIDHVLYVKDDPPGVDAPAMQLVGANPGVPFARLYKLAALRPEN